MSKFTEQQITAIAAQELREIEKGKVSGIVTITLEANCGAVARVRTNRERVIHAQVQPNERT